MDTFASVRIPTGKSMDTLGFFY